MLTEAAALDALYTDGTDAQSLNRYVCRRLDMKRYSVYEDPVYSSGIPTFLHSTTPHRPKSYLAEIMQSRLEEVLEEDAVTQRRPLFYL